MKPRAAGEADECFLVQSDEVRGLQRHSASDDAVEIMNMMAATQASITRGSIHKCAICRSASTSMASNQEVAATPQTPTSAGCILRIRELDQVLVGWQPSARQCYC